MSDDGKFFLIGLMIGFCVIGAPLMYLSDSGVSNYWKTEIVRRGYGTWETTPTGEVWFKWKDSK